MMIIERRIEEPWISIITRSGDVTSSDKVNEKKESGKTWVRKTVEKVPIYYIQNEK